MIILVRSVITEIIQSDSENEKENEALMARNIELERLVKEMQAQIEREKKETKEAKKKLADSLKTKKELSLENAKLKEKFDLKRENSDLKRKNDLLSPRDDKDKSTTSTSPGTSPQSSPDKLTPKQQDTELESPVKRLKVDNDDKKKKSKSLALRKISAPTSKSPKENKSPKKNKSSKNSGWIAPLKGAKTKANVFAISKIFLDQEAAKNSLKRVEAKPKETDDLFIFEDTFNPAPSDTFMKKKTPPKSKNKDNMFAKFDLALTFKPKPKPSMPLESPKDSVVERRPVFDEKKELEELEKKWNVDEQFFIKQEPMTQDIRPVPPVDVMSQELFDSESNGSVILCDPDPVELPIYTISDNTCTEEDDCRTNLKGKTSVTDFESFFKKKAIQSRDVYEGECDNCKAKYDKRAEEIDLEKANMEVLECPLDNPCKGYTLRVKELRKKPNFIANVQIIRANKRAPRTKVNEERNTPDNFWDINISPVKNQHLKPRKFN